LEKTRFSKALHETKSDKPFIIYVLKMVKAWKNLVLEVKLNFKELDFKEKGLKREKLKVYLSKKI